MTKPSELNAWRAASVLLAIALIAALIELHRSSTTGRLSIGMSPSVNRDMNLEHLAMSPKARRVHERYSL